MIPQQRPDFTTPANRRDGLMAESATETRKNLERALVIATVALVNVAAFARMGVIYELGLGAFLAVAIAGRARGAVHFVLLFFLMSAMRDALPGLAGEMPSIKAVVPLAASTLLMLPFTKREAFAWMRAGSVDVATALIGAVTSAVSIAALLVWAFWTTDFGEGPAIIKFFSAHFPAWMIFAFGAPLFALVNAFSEEAVYRGLSQATIGDACGPGAAIALQSTLYAAAHFLTGFPNGYAGYAMTFSYGCVLGYMRQRTGGIKASCLTHVAADLTIAYFLAFSVL